MTRLGKILFAVAAVLLLIAGAMWFFFLRDREAPSPADGGHMTVQQPSGNTTTGYGTIDPGSSTSSGDKHIVLPPDESTGDSFGDVSGITSSAGDGAGSSSAEGLPLVNEDGIPTAEAIRKAQETDVNLYGRLVIPLAGINVRLYQTTESRVIQADDSAVLFSIGDAVVIADMWKQGFSGLQNVTKGSEMYMVTNAGATHYLCSRSEKAIMVQNDLEYSDGSCVSKAPVGAISCYSQMNAAGDIWVCEFTDTGETSSQGPGSEKEQGGDTSSTNSENSSFEPAAPPDWTSGAGYEFSVKD